METNIKLDKLIQGLQQSVRQEQIANYCHAFCQLAGFDNYLLYGSIFSSLLSPPAYLIYGPGQYAGKINNSLQKIIHACMESSTPIVTGNITKQSSLYHSPIKTCPVPHAKTLSISFPVHFPLGRLAFLHLSTPIKKSAIEEKVLSSLPSANIFAREAGIAVLALFESELENTPPYLNQRERECMLMASDGANPRQISVQFGLSHHTVNFYLKKAREKLHSKNIQGAIGKAMLAGEIETLIGSEKS